jgi:TonB family protein
VVGIQSSLAIALLIYGATTQAPKPPPCRPDALCCPARLVDFCRVGCPGPPPTITRRVAPDMKNVARPHPDGTAILEIGVNTEGRVISACVLRTLRPDFDRAAQAAARRWRFEPKLLKATPVGVAMTATISPHTSDLGR